MVPFSPIGGAGSFATRLQEVIRSAFLLCQSSSDVSSAVKAIFQLMTGGATTLTLGTTAPDVVTQTTPTHWITMTAPDGSTVIVAAWKVAVK